MNKLISPHTNPYAPHWLIGDKKIYNQWEATRTAFKQGGPAYRYVFLEEQYDTLDWTKEPDETWEELCLLQALRLRNKYKKLKLFFSAGRDSGHIWRVFEQNNIPIDEIIVGYSPYHPQRRYEFENFLYPKAIELCRRHPKMKLRVMSIDLDQFDLQFGNEDWIEGEQCHLNRMLFEPHRYSRVLPALDPDATDPQCGYVLGLEKPRIVLLDGHFAFRHLDTDAEVWVFNLPNLEWFYWAPEMPKLFLKQCWMAVNYFESRYPGADADFIAKFQNPWTVYYDEWCKSVGRGPAMIWECGNGVQKVNNNYHPSIQASIAYAQNQNWSCYHTWRSIIDDCSRNWSHCFNEGDPMKGRIGIWGKPYLMKQQAKVDQ